MPSRDSLPAGRYQSDAWFTVVRMAMVVIHASRGANTPSCTPRSMIDAKRDMYARCSPRTCIRDSSLARRRSLMTSMA